MRKLCSDMEVFAIRNGECSILRGVYTLRYAEYVQDGDLISFHGDWLVSKAIQYWTQSQISHVGICIRMHNIPCVLESIEGTGIRIVPIKHCIDTYTCPIYWQPLKQNNIDKAVFIKFLLSKWGKAYPSLYQFLVIMSPTIQRVRKCLGKSLDVDRKAWHCSEFIAQGLLHAGYTFDKCCALVTPDEISKLPIFCGRIRLSQS